MTSPANNPFGRYVSDSRLGAVHVYPDLAVGAVVDSPAADWTLGNFAEIIPANTIANPFVILGAYVVDAPVDPGAPEGLYEIKLYYGASDTYFAPLYFQYLTTDQPNARCEIPAAALGRPIPANSQIRAKMAYEAGSGGGTSSMRVTLFYAEVEE